MGSPKRISPMTLAEFSRHRSTEVKKLHGTDLSSPVKSKRYLSNHSTSNSKRRAFEQKFSSLLVYGMQLKVRLKHTKDMRVAHCHRKEMKSTEAQMREIALCAGWTNSDLSEMMPSLYRKHHKSLVQYEASIRSRSQKRRMPLGPRDKRVVTPISPLAHPSQPKLIEEPFVGCLARPSNINQILDFDFTPKRLDIQVKPRCVFEESWCGLKKFDIVLFVLIVILSIVVSLIFTFSESA